MEWSPTNKIDVSFAHYIEQHDSERMEHMHDGVMDYAFDMDTLFARRLGRIPYFESMCDKAMQIIANQDIAAIMRSGLRAGPKQYPEIDQMAIDCARRLHIAPPAVYIMNNPTVNAFTYGMDNGETIIQLFTGIIDHMTPAQLKCIIGHECGHIHNNHIRYRTVIDVLLNNTGGLLGKYGKLTMDLLNQSNAALIKSWSRACEVTADRAAVICADDPNDAITALQRLMSGTINGGYTLELDYKEIERQLSEVSGSVLKLQEIMDSHPNDLRRILCMREFANSEILMKWRPDLRDAANAVKPQEAVEARCKQLVNVFANM